MRSQFQHSDNEEILRRALAIDATDQGDDRASLVLAAEELGISTEALERAEAEWRQEKAEKADLAEFMRHNRRDFFEHLATYVAVNVGLVGLNFLTSGGITWAKWSIIGWGIGVLIHAASAYLGRGEDFDAEFAKWRKKHRRKTKA
jgi:hypothetical protein